MSEGIPPNLRWRDFKRAVEKLGYSLFENKRGSARTFRNPNRIPEFVTFHEPHGSDTIRKGTLRDYINKLALQPKEFLELLD